MLKRVLLVDDDDITNFFNQHLISKLGIAEEITVVLNGQEAIDFLTTQEGGVFPSPDLVLLDINMPIMDGYQFLAAHDSLPPEQKAKSVYLMLTTELLPEDKAKTDRFSTLSGFLNKPLEESELLDKIN